MDQEQWEKVNQIVDTALKLEGEERSTFIEEKCAGNQDLKSQVTELLEAIEKSKTQDLRADIDEFISHVADDISHDSDTEHTSSLIGQTIDKYKIIELIGHGGMGSVFLAERADGAYDQKVALKVLRRGMDTPSNVARFKRERNILARLNHPNIARLLDGGVTKSGLPYLIMEYVDGNPLRAYCNSHRLSVKERLDLFQSVCQAVQHAHRNATIHRDLKPSNIYVTDDGTVKVLDFGIAKLLESGDPEKTLFQTQQGARLLTLRYAAPEQIENETITTATDSYTLGILLYELLAGTHPIDAEQPNITEIEKIVRNQTPFKPSAKFTNLSHSQKEEIASQRNTTISDLTGTLQGDLDAIVMKALRKEPGSRYPSVEQLLEDLTRYNQSRPLIAQSDTLRYRIGKFMRRNRNAVVGGLLIVAAIIGFGSYHINQITKERNIATTEAHKAETVKDFIVDIFRSSNPQSTSFEGKDLSAKQLLINGKNRVSNELVNQPSVYVEVLFAIGDALKNIDAFEEAEESYKKALAKSSETKNPLQNKTKAYVKLGSLIYKWSNWTKNQDAKQAALTAQKLLKQIEDPPSALKASVFSIMGKTRVAAEKFEESNFYYEKADSVYTKAGMENSFEYIQMLNSYGRSLLYLPDFKKAKQVLKRSNKLHQKTFSNPTIILADNYKLLGWACRDLGDFEKSTNYFLQSIDLNNELTGKESLPKAASMYHLAINYILSGEYEKGEKLAKKVVHIYQKSRASDSSYMQNPKKWIAIAKYNQNKFLEAEHLLEEIIKTRTTLSEGKDHIGIAAASAHLAVVYRKTERFKEAISLLEKTVHIYKRELGEHNRRVGRTMIKLASTYRDMGKYEMAKKYFQKVKAIQRNVLPANHREKADFHFEYAKLKLDMNESRQAQQHFLKAYTIYQNNFGEDSKRTKQAKSYLEQLAQA